MSKLTLREWLERDPETRKLTVQAVLYSPTQGHLVFKRKGRRHGVGFVLSDRFDDDVEQAIVTAEEMIQKIDSTVEVPAEKKQ